MTDAELETRVARAQQAASDLDKAIRGLRRAVFALIITVGVVFGVTLWRVLQVMHLL